MKDSQQSASQMWKISRHLPGAVLKALWCQISWEMWNFGRGGKHRQCWCWLGFPVNVKLSASSRQLLFDCAILMPLNLCMCSKCLWSSGQHFVKPLKQWLSFFHIGFSLSKKLNFWQNIQSANPLGWSTPPNESPHLGPCSTLHIIWYIRILPKMIWSVSPIFGGLKGCSKLCFSTQSYLTTFWLRRQPLPAWAPRGHKGQSQLKACRL